MFTRIIGVAFAVGLLLAAETARSQTLPRCPIGTPVGVAFDPAAACFFDADGVTAVHRTDRPEVGRPDRAEAMGDRQTRERSVL